MSTTITPRSIPEVEDDIRRYSEWLTLDCVRSLGHWYAETEAKLDAAKAELVAAKHRARARATVDRAKVRSKDVADAAWLDAVQDIAHYANARAGAR